MERTQKPKVLWWLVLIWGVLSLVGMACYVGYNYWQLRSKYQDVWDVQITEEEIESKYNEIEHLEKKLADIETEIARMKDNCEAKEQLLAKGRDTELQKEQLLLLYEQNIELVEEAKLLVLEGLGYDVTEYYANEEHKDDWRNNVIGELTGNSLVSEGIIGGLDAAEDEVSFDSIVSGIKDGIVNGVPSFTADALTDILAGDAGGGVIGAVSLITDVFTVNDVPEKIVNALIYAQERYSTYLTNFIAAEQVSPEDIRWVADSYYQMRLITEQLAIATGGQRMNEDEIVKSYERLKELAEEYQANNEYLLLHTENTADSVGEK